jgi:hypothetical protein
VRNQIDRSVENGKLRTPFKKIISQRIAPFALNLPQVLIAAIVESAGRAKRDGAMSDKLQFVAST